MSDLEALIHWCRSRHTSTPIGRAIFALHSGEADRERVWEDPTDEELAAVMAVAWQHTDEPQLYWGAEPMRRAEEAER